MRQQLLGLKQLRPEIHRALEIQKPNDVYWSVLEGGKLALLNFTDHEALVRLSGGKTLAVPPFGILMTPSWR
jgi:hypothetical protein